MADTIGADIVVVGAGNAALTAAVAAAEKGARVLVLEKAPKLYRGGNSTQTAVMRFAYNGVEDLLPLIDNISDEERVRLASEARIYTEADYYNDIMDVTGGRSDPELAETLVSNSYSVVRYLRDKGHSWVPQYYVGFGGPAIAFSGGGLGHQERWFAILERMRVGIHYETRAMDLLQDETGRVSGVRAISAKGFITFKAKAVILASGGFEANPEMRTRYLGHSWDLVPVRGVPFNTGDGIRMALEIGALPHGNWSSCHATPQDVNRPAFNLPNVGVESGEWSRGSYHLGIMVNKHGKRFADEGETWRGLTYAKFGREIVAQPGSIAFEIFDAKIRSQQPSLLQSGYDKKATRVQASSIEGLAEHLGIDPLALAATVRDFNSAVQPVEFNPYVLDGKRTTGITPPKSNWAVPIDTPPYEAFPVCCGITFTYGGLRCNSKAQVLHMMDRPIPGLYAAGELVGGLWYGNYAMGSGMMAGSVFGKIAGEAAAKEAMTEV